MALTISRVTPTPAGNNTTGTTFTITSIGADFAVDDMVVVMIAADNAGSGGSTTNITSLADTAGNTWVERSNTIYDPGAANAGIEEAIYTCRVTNAISSTDDLVITFNVTTIAKAVTIYKIANDGTVRAAYVTTGTHAGAATGTPALTSGTVTSGDTLFYHIAIEGNSTPTGDSDTTNGNWSTVAFAAFGSTTSGAMDVSQYKTVTATATQTWNPTFTSRDTKASWITITPENIPTPQTWTGNGASVEVAATSGSFIDAGVAWEGSGATIQMSATSGSFRVFSDWSITASATTTAGAGSPQTWTGNATSVQIVAASGDFSYASSPQTWTGNAAVVTIVAASGSFIPGGATWTGNGVLVGIVAQSGAFIVGVPPPPTLTLDFKDTDQIDISWSAVPGASGYDIERNGSVIVWNHPSTSYSDTGLSPSTEYTHRVRAVLGATDLPFATTVNATTKQIEDQYGNPWFGVGDTPWSLVAQISPAEIESYLDDIAALGLNFILVNVPEPNFTDNSPKTNNQQGDAPFTGALFNSSLNEPYWTVVDDMLLHAKSLGITVMICPQYIGYNDTEGFGAELTSVYGSNPSALTAYGQALAARYPASTYPNIIWIIGHDRISMTTAHKAASKLIADELPAGHLLCLGCNHEVAGGSGDGGWAGSGITSDFDTLYTYGEDVGSKTTTIRTTKTVMFIEGKYEQEQGVGVGSQILRVQNWDAFMAGAVGTLFGNNPRWHFESGKELYSFSGTWEQSIGDAAYNDGTIHTAHLATFINDNPGILETVPDTAGTFALGGWLGRFNTTMGVAYKTGTGSLSLDTTELAGTGNVKIRRFDPTNASYTTVAASEAQNSSRSITYPGANAAGGTDWVYIVELA